MDTVYLVKKKEKIRDISNYSHLISFADTIFLFKNYNDCSTKSGTTNK